MSVLSERLLLLRDRNELSQTHVAKMLHLSQTGYYLYEKGQNTPPPETLIKLANFYNVSVDYLLGNEPENQFLYCLLQDIKNLTPERQNKVADCVRLLKIETAYTKEQQRRADRKRFKRDASK